MVTIIYLIKHTHILHQHLITLILTVDGVGEYETTTLSVYNGNTNIPIDNITFPHSLGMLYSTITPS